MVITLTDEERQRFLGWLHQEWESGRAIAEQLEKISVPKAVVERTKAEAVACKLVAQMLTSVEEVTAQR